MGKSSRSTKRSNHNSKRKTISKLSSIPGTPFMYVNSNGYVTVNSGTNGYVTATSEQLVVIVYTVQTDLVRLPIAESGHVYVLGIGFIPFDVEYVTYQTLYSTYRKIPTQPLPNILEAYQRLQCKQSLARPNSFLFTVIERVTDTMIGFAVGSLETAEKSFTLPTNNVTSFFSNARSNARSNSNARQLTINEGSPYVDYHLLGVFKSEIQKNVNFHGSSLMSICIQLLNPSYRKESRVPLDIPIYLEAIKDPNVIGFYERMGFYRFTKEEGKKLFDHPLKEGRVKNAPHLLLM